MRLGVSWALTILICGLAAACNTSSQVEFKDVLGSNTPTSVTNGLMPSEGGFMMKPTASHITNLSVGASLSSSQLSSAGGYKIQLNLQGQLAQ